VAARRRRREEQTPGQLAREAGGEAPHGGEKGAQADRGGGLREMAPLSARLF
jgi:hypothetical protein